MPLPPLPAAFFRLHRDLPREGPGTDAATAEAVRRLPPLPEPRAPRVLDLGCGPGRSTLVLAQSFPGTTITAVDAHEPFLGQLRRSAAAAGLADRIEAVNADMGALEVAPGTVDLIWSEGAVYLLGFVAGLGAWRDLLKPGGAIAVTELCWLTDDRPPEAAGYLAAEYADMTDMAGCERRIVEAGLEPVDRFALPREAWDEYHGPMASRIAALRSEAAADPALSQVIEEVEREIDMARRFGDRFGNAFFLMRRPDAVGALSTGPAAHAI